jgi:Fic family protein
MGKTMLDIEKLRISPEMLALIAELDEFKGAWQLLGRLAPERLRALRKIATIESIGSSTRIEGATLSDLEVEKLLSDLKAHSFVSRDEQEVAGYAYVCDEVFQNFEAIDFSENIIKQLHSWLLKYSDKDQRHRGEYKKLPNHVEAFDAAGKSIGIVFQTATPFETPMKMHDLVSWTQEQLEHKTLHPLLIIGIFIVVFLAIHPFQDGNGRLSRVLTTLLLLKSGYVYVPYSSLESIIERNKKSYYMALAKTQKSLTSDKPDFHPWLLFFLQSLHKQKVHLDHKISREKILMLHVSDLVGNVLTLLADHGKLTISQLETMTGANRNTLKKNLALMVKQGHINRLGRGRATWYALA